ncbi:MAG TPA: 2-succinyl-5-enolpyruvyl-6-hydroxy-3-cyclohexene-1-carboxylic-acid synthase [Actinomycetota bacterium]|nr:2-succinyl-5-enolpyruvyl-6-hydroxy-3-cyclohexene-1-carboxylic-acid synthase [Actinomycetota bacterium]
MSTGTEGDVALACMSALVDGLVSQGLEHACISPGSRSTPLAVALSRHPDVSVHVHLDERSSAFFGLGMAKATERPVAVACTSGTAAANLFPAVVEASMSRTPLVLLTADRPPELHGVGANQTIDQRELFGGYVKRFVDTGVPGEQPDVSHWFAVGLAATDVARRHPPGPAHVNLPFREPLTPSADDIQIGHDLLSSGRGRAGARTRRTDVEALAEQMKGVERGVLFAGSLRRDAFPVVELARTLGWALIAEPTSGLRVSGALSAGAFLLASESFLSTHVPELVVQVGAAPTSRAGLAFVADSKRLVIVDPDGLVADPAHHASLRVEADPASLSRALLKRTESRGGSGWWREWEEADRIARRAVDELVDSWEEPFEGRVARDLAAFVPDGATLVVGSSMPARDLDAYMRPRPGVRVLGNRGASGIDGFVSTALGVAASGASTFALMGDLTLLHDASGLLWSGGRGNDAVFVVPNNDGGAIFSFLEQRRLPEFVDLFVTPHGLDLSKVAAGAAARHALVERGADLGPTVIEASRSGGVWIVEVPSDRDLNAARHHEVDVAVASALEAQG